MRVTTNPIEFATLDASISRVDADWRDVLDVLVGDPEALNSRSQWQWFRLPNGELILGTFPQGATYTNIDERIGI